MIKFILIFFYVAAIASEPPPSQAEEKLSKAISADDLGGVKAILDKDPSLLSGPCGNGDPTEIAAQQGSMKVLRYLGTRVNKTSIDCAFRQAIYSNQIEAVRYFAEELKVPSAPIFLENGFYNVGSTNNVEIIEYLFSHYKIDQRDLDRTYTDAVISGRPAMAEALKKRGARFLDPVKAISLMALDINNGTGLNREPLLSFAIATQKDVTTRSKRIDLKPTWPKTSAPHSKDGCPTPILTSLTVPSKVESYQMNNAGCEVQLKQDKWRATIYGTTIIYEKTDLVKVKDAKGRAEVPIQEVAQSGWWANWLENDVNYLAAFECRDEKDASCLTKESVRGILSGLQPARQPK